jgi:hydroxypyruvate reductase 1
MIEGFKMNLIYYDLYQATRLEKFVTGKDIYLPLHICIALHVCQVCLHKQLPCALLPAYGQFLKANGEQPVTWKRAATMEDVLREADVVRFITPCN